MSEISYFISLESVIYLAGFIKHGSFTIYKIIWNSSLKRSVQAREPFIRGACLSLWCKPNDINKDGINVLRTVVIYNYNIYSLLLFSVSTSKIIDVIPKEYHISQIG